MPEASYSSAARASQAGEQAWLQDLWLTIRRNRWVVLSIAAATLALAAVVTWLQKPVYESIATVRIEDGKGGPSLFASVAPLAGAAAGSGMIETEMEVLRSRKIAEAVVDTLGLQVELVEPEVGRSSVLRVLETPRDVEPGLFTLRHRGGGRYSLSGEELRPGTALPTTVEIGRPFAIGGLRVALEPALAGDPPEEVRFRVHPFARAVASIRDMLRVYRSNPEAEIVSIAFRSADPSLAAAVPNLTAESFIRYKTRSSKGEASSTVGFLREQVASYDRQLKEAENRLRGFREEAQVVSLADEATAQVERLAKLQAERDQYRSERDALGRLLLRVEADGGGSTTSSPYRQLASFPVFLVNPAVQDILKAITELETKRSDLLVRRTPANQDVVAIDERIDELERQLHQTARAYMENLEGKLATLEANLERFGGQLEAIPAREVEFARLAREQKLLEEISTLLQMRLKEAEIKEAVEPGDVRVIDPALVPETQISPKPFRNLALGGMLGLVLGLAVAYGREALDVKVRTREDVDATTGGIPVLGLIPRIRMPAAVSPTGNGRGRIRIQKIAPQAFLQDRLVTHLDPRNPASEAYRTLRTNITFASAGGAPRALVVTSAMPGDGKSTSSSNLAITLAQQGVKTLLVDADLRRGVLHEVFGLRQDPGLTHVLLGRTPLAEAIQEVEVEGEEPLYFLSAGVFPPNPAELLGSERMKELLETLRDSYEMIIFDAPPLTRVADSAILGTLTDGTLLVTRVGATDRRALHHAVTQLRQLRAAVSGIVLNDCRSGQAAYSYYGQDADNGRRS